jgi:NAD-dependent SIR2 family protein deacetylase
MSLAADLRLPREQSASDVAADSVARFLDRHPRLLVLTGAGCSTASGIPDYRDEAGAWKHRRPMSFHEFTSSAAARRRYWAGSLRGWPRVRDAQPSGAHAVLQLLEQQGRVDRIVTQNVDGLHRKAGSRRVIDLHGRLDVVECLSCGAHCGREDVQTLLVRWNAQRLASEPGALRPDGDTAVADDLASFQVPDCRECGGVLKPHVVFFGENVPRLRVEEVYQSLRRVDALLVVGSSLMVYSGYRFVLAALELGLSVAAINQGSTRADGLFALKVVGECGAVLARAARTLGMVSRCP